MIRLTMSNVDDSVTISTLTRVRIVTSAHPDVMSRGTLREVWPDRSFQQARSCGHSQGGVGSLRGRPELRRPYRSSTSLETEVDEDAETELAAELDRRAADLDSGVVTRRFAVVIHPLAVDETEAVERYYRQTGEAASTRLT